MAAEGLCKTGLTTVLIRVTRGEEAASITGKSSSIFTVSILRPPYTQAIIMLTLYEKQRQNMFLFQMK